mgnify:CR=1 FL=1|uniref:Uncharacterized protein n=1 Tax=viral metagenome TaxID=1070528 RepID=A0A6C0KCS8_9ZZZZ
MNDKEFRQNVKEFNEVASLIDAAKEKMKVLTTRKKTLENTIVVFMKSNNFEECVTKKNKLVHKESKRKVPVKKKDAEKNLADFFDSLDWDAFMELSSIQKADAVNAYMASKRKTVTESKLGVKKVQDK